jgi:hypothetical protein
MLYILEAHFRQRFCDLMLESTLLISCTLHKKKQRTPLSWPSHVSFN